MTNNGAQMLEIDDRGIGSFLASNMDEIDDSVLMFGAPKGINSMRDVAERMAGMGRGGDEYIVHASEREVMVPREVAEKNPEMLAMINRAIAAEGADPDAYIVGSENNSINPVTGQREFFLKKLVKGIKKAVKGVVKVVKKIAPVVLPFVLNAVFPGMGTVFSGALGAGVGSLVQGKSFKDSMKAALIGGAMGGLSSGIGNIGKEGGFLGGVGKGFQGNPDYSFFGRKPIDAPVATLSGAGPGPADAAGGTLNEAAEGAKSFAGKAREVLLPSKQELLAKNIESFKATVPGFGELSAADQIAQAAPGVFQQFGPAALAGTGIAMAAGAFDPPEGQSLPEGFSPYPELTQEEIDAVRVGVPDRYPLPNVNDSIVPASGTPGVSATDPQNMVQMAGALPNAMAPDPNAPSFGLPDLQLPSLQELIAQGQIGSDQVFGYDRFGNPISGIYAANGGGVQNFPRKTGPISGPGTGTSDSVPAMLSDGEFVMTADAVRGAGGGNRQQGMNNMYNMMRMFEGGAVA
mgnify:CR=1 FL=1|tara:strand:- start:4868 stop:6424 length:1557 start_codon:yes stop_codon:yes gene_type:complete